MYELIRDLEQRKEKEVRAQIEKEEILRTIKVRCSRFNLNLWTIAYGQRIAHCFGERAQEGT